MGEPIKVPEPQQLDFEICLKEIRASGVLMEEAGEYVMYFCGLDCYQAWRERFNKA